MSSKYRITNATRKKNPQSAREKIGFLVGVAYLNGGIKTRTDLAPGRSVIADTLEESHLKQYKAGNLDIEEIEDISVLLKKHITAPEKKTTKKASKKTAKKTTKKAAKSSKQKGAAMSMGDASTASAKDFKKTHDNDEGGTNPGGKDNFTAVAPSIAGNKLNDESFSASPSSLSED